MQRSFAYVMVVLLLLACRGGLEFPADLSPAAVDLLKNLLHRDANERLGAGPLDAEEIKVGLHACFG